MINNFRDKLTIFEEKHENSQHLNTFFVISMSLSEEERRKRSRKARTTKTKNEKAKSADREKLESQKRSNAKLRAELKAYKSLIDKGWTPPGGK